MSLLLETLCPHCQTRFVVERMNLGSRGRCSRCHGDFVVTETSNLQIIAKTSDTDVTLPLLESDAFSQSSLAGASVSCLVESVPEATKSNDGAGSWNVGDVILGIYEVREIAPGKPFASGGLGVVHRIWHREWGMDLAVKSPKPDAIKSRRGKVNYEHEALHWLHLALHPNIVSCYMVRRIDNIPRLFAEFANDGSLWDVIADGRLYRGGIETTRVRLVDYLIQFAWGLEHAHNNHLLHLDIKPGNVMLAGTTVKVTDFGLAMLVADELEEQNTDNKLLGMTPNYCSPEQYEMFTCLRENRVYDGPPISIKSDIWSFAVTAMAMIFGKTPCRIGYSARESLESFLTQEKNTPLAARMVRGLDELLLECLEKDPAKRPASMTDIAERLVTLYHESFGMEYPRPHPERLSSNVEGLNNSAVSFLDLGKIDEAASAFRQANVLQPWHPQVTYNNTLLEWRRGKIDDIEAMRTLESLTQINHLASTAWYALGLIQRERGNIWGALNAIEKGLELENRLDIQRTRDATAPLALSTVRVHKQITLPQERFINLYISDRENLLLTIPATRDLIIHGILDTATDLVLKRVANPNTERIAISSDYQWEILADEANQSLRLCRVGITATRSRFHPIDWKTLHEPSASGSVWRFTVTKPNEIAVIDVARDRVVGKLRTDTTITAMACSSDARSQWVATGHSDGMLRLWELPQCRCVRTIENGGAAVEAIFFSSHQEFILVLTSDTRLHIVELALITQHSSQCRAPFLISVMSAVEDASRLQIEGKQTSQAIDHAIFQGDIDTALQHLSRLQSLPGWEAVRRSFAHWDFLYRRAERVAPQDSVCIHSFRLVDQASAIALSAKANVIIASGRDPVLCLWTLEHGTMPCVLSGHTDWVRSLAITSDAKFVVSGSWDASVRVWNTSTGRTVRRLPVPIPMLSQLALDHRGRCVAVVSELGRVKVWAMATNEIVGEWTSPVKSAYSVCFSRDDRTMAVGCGDGRVIIRRYRESRNAWEFSIGSAAVTAVALTSDMRYCIAGDSKGQIVTWDFSTGRVVHTHVHHTATISSLRLGLDDRWVAASSHDGTVSLNHITDSVRRVLFGQSVPITSLAMNYSGSHLVSGAEDGSIRLRELYWNLATTSDPDLDRAGLIIRAMITSLELPFGELDPVSRRRIHNELSYCGYGMLPAETIDAIIDTAWAEETKA
ncbi:MAG: protein kinase domain-containing protein [Thermoguttaceae bacterium]